MRATARATAVSGETERRVCGSKPVSDNYAICVGGYPVVYKPTFAAAAEAARATMIRRRDAPGDVSIYEVETGIHFEVPRGPRPDDFPHEALTVLGRMGLVD